VTASEAPLIDLDVDPDRASFQGMLVQKSRASLAGAVSCVPSAPSPVSMAFGPGRRSPLVASAENLTKEPRSGPPNG
jgi:hypothetical protein